MQNIAQQQRAARKQAQHYAQSVDFMGMMEAGSFEEEVEDDTRWAGMNRDEAGVLQVYAEFVYDEGMDSGTGWWL